MRKSLNIIPTDTMKADYDLYLSGKIKLKDFSEKHNLRGNDTQLVGRIIMKEKNRPICLCNIDPYQKNQYLIGTRCVLCNGKRENNK